MDKIWPESYKILEGGFMYGDMANRFTDTIANFCIVIAIIFFFILGFVRITGGLQIVLSGAFNYKNLINIEEHTNLYTNRNTLLAFLVMVLSFMIANSNVQTPLMESAGAVWFDFVLVILFFILYFSCRQLMCAVLNWVNKSKVFWYIIRFYYTYTVLALLLSIFGLALYMLFPGIGEQVLRIYLVCTLSIVAVTYFTRGNQIIISNGFSHFFWILYLCTLEILPLLVLWHVIVS